MRTTSVVLAASGILLASTPSSAEFPKSKDKLEDVIASAKANGKALVIEFTADWCKPCQVFNKTVLQRSDVKKALETVHFVKYDIDDGGPGEAAYAYFGVTGVPAFVIVNAQGALAVRRGAISATKFLELIEEAALHVLTERDVKSKLASRSKDPAIYLRTARWYRNKGRIAEAEAHYRKAIAADPTGDYYVRPLAGWECMMMRRHHAFRTRVAREALSFAKSFPKGAWARRELTIAAASTQFDAKTIEKAAAVIAAKLHQRDLNEAAYDFMAAGALDAALLVARKQVRLARTRPNGHDTLAEVLHMRGERQAAIAASQQGIDLDTFGKRSELTVNLKRFKASGAAVLSPSVVKRRADAQEHLAQPAGYIPTAQRKRKKRSPSKPLTAREKAYRAYFTGTRKALDSVGTACRGDAKKTKEAYVRVELAAKGGHPKKVWVLEPGISRKLRRCLIRELKRVEFPKPLSLNGRIFEPQLTRSVRFRH